MGVWNRMRPHLGSKSSDINVAPQETTTTTDHEKSPNIESPTDGNSSVAEDALPAEDVTEGVKNMEAITLVWTRSSLIGLFICIWFVYLLNAFQSSTVGSLVPYVTSSWGDHSLLNVIDVVASSMTAAVFIPLAKLLDLWGRAEGYLLMVAFAELGLILMATSTNLSIYCAANVGSRPSVIDTTI
jgi:Na+/melibiose symporter-like transporter